MQAETIAPPGRPAQAKGPKDTRYHSLDLWRGVACLLVAALHASYYMWHPAVEFPAKGIFHTIRRLLGAGWIGVPMFFVISGYCITAACDTPPRTNGSSIVEFFRRRFRRIFPPYWAALFGSALVIGLMWIGGFGDVLSGSYRRLPLPWELSAVQWFGNTFLIEKWREHLFGPPLLFLLAPAWTLCYEEQFYAVCGFGLFFSRRKFFTLMSLVTIGVLAFGIANRVFGNHLNPSGFFFDGRWFTFALGILAYYTIHRATPAQRRLFTGIILLVGAISLLCSRGSDNDKPLEIFAASIFTVLILILYKWDIAISSSARLRPLMLCGTMCYSLYLIHWPIVKGVSHVMFSAGLTSPAQFVFISLPVSMVIAVVVAWQFHVHIERRFLNKPPTLPAIRRIELGTSIQMQPVQKTFFSNLVSGH